jgi:hypothetical protein
MALAMGLWHRMMGFFGIESASVKAGGFAKSFYITGV